MTDMQESIREMVNRREKMKQGGGKERIDKQHARGKGTARERIEMLVDPGTFSELQPFIESRKRREDVKGMGEGVVTGYAKIHGSLVFLFSQDFTVFGGTLGEMHAKKIAHVMDLAAENGAPIIGLNDSGGARIQEGVLSLDGYGQVFYRNVQYSGLIPQISVIMGPCAGGAVYSPAMTDFVFMVEKTSQMFITGPKVIESVTGAVINSEELGGAKVHAAKSGNAHFTAPTEQQVLQKVRRLLEYLPSSDQENHTSKTHKETVNEPEEHDEKMLHVIPVDSRKAYDVHNVIKRILDGDSFMEVQSDFAKNIVIGFGRIKGEVVGIVANNPKILAGGLDIDSSDKCARFIRCCNCFHIPIITLEDVSGFLPGIEQEHEGIIRHGAKIIYAYAEATVPKITVIMRKAIGGAYVALNSKAIGADIVYAWPNAEVAVMGPEGSANIVFAKEIKESTDPEKTRQEKIQEYKERFFNPYLAAKNGMIDDVIDPRATRKSLADALWMLRRKRKQTLKNKIGNMPL